MVILETSRLAIHPFEERHLTGDYVGWLNDPQIVRYSENRHMQHTEASCRAYFESMQSGEHLFLAVHSKEADAPHVGNLTVYLDRANEVADLAIMIGNRSQQKRGLGREAWCAMVDHLIDTMKIRRVQAGTMSENRPMRNLFRASNMTEEACCPERFLLDGRPVDLILAARLRDATEA